MRILFTPLVSSISFNIFLVVEFFVQFNTSIHVGYVRDNDRRLHNSSSFRVLKSRFVTAQRGNKCNQDN